ncbi:MULTISPECIES: MBL fold metallo-hydrolase [Cupriavidus]|uniref:MBL fold metallo-hydrolase n=1 Tax=Cupriavidus TaxID=106589 RepID=UPI00035FA128|nr:MULTISPECIES: MBL fold metallo-hydrolase [Cupriavidus]
MSAPIQRNQQPGWTRFRHGDFECTVVTDGLLHMGPPRDTFPHADPQEIDRLLADAYLPTETIELDQNLLIVNTGRQLVLFDTGVGINAELGVKTFGKLTGRALSSMRAAGIAPEQIDVIALTHAHPDHCWGLVDDDGNKLYPNARVCINRVDMEYWTDLGNIRDTMSEHMKDHFRGAHLNILAYRDVITFLADGDEVVPGITAHLTPGHSPGHMVYRIASQGRALLNWGDLCHHQILLLKRPNWAFKFDSDSAAAAVSRLRVLDWACGENMEILSYHFPFPGRGHLRRNADGYDWLPTRLELEAPEALS